MTEFTIPFLPPSLNTWSRLHWRAWQEKNEAWQWRVRESIPLGSPMYECAVVVTLTFQCPQLLDPDNYTKFMLDGLVGVLIPNDDGETIAETRLRYRRGPKATHVRIEPFKASSP